MSYAQKLKKRFEDLGFYVKIEVDDEDIDDDFDVPAAINVADNPEFEHHYKDDSHTGIFFYYYPIEDGFKLHINTITIKKEDRGKGLGGKFIETIIHTFGNTLKEIELSDLSDSDFWWYMAEKYYRIKWNIED